ncbi:sialidase family protein, partial [Rubrivirga sp.]|uniref:sialidase family protein n=1 Tax=Rubrivirga sp. TaxID=1885344 RepID=UPI003C7323CB
ATTDLLGGSPLPFQRGAGLDLEAISPAWSGLEGAHGEWEVPVVVRRFADGAVTNEPGDTFGFRLVEGERPVSATATVVLEVERGHLGGTFVETPGRIGPWQASNGDLYFIIEPTESDNVLMVVTSSDGGATWREVDGANRPTADDLEGVGADLEGGTLHVLHQTSDHVWRHVFRTSDHPTAPDTWGITDESVAAPGNPPTQVASLVARPDGSLVAAYGGLETILVKVRSADGTWGPEIAVDPGGPIESGPHLALGDGLEVHLAYTDGAGSAWYRRVRAGGSLSPRVRLSTGLGTAEHDVGAVAPLAVLEDGTVVVVYRLADGGLWERRLEGDAVSEPVRITDRTVVQNAVDSEQVGADVVAVGDAVHVLFIEDETGHLYHAVSRDRESWTTRLVADDVRAQWVRGRVLVRPDGTSTYGVVLDAGSDGGAGMNRYLEVGLGD